MKQLVGIYILIVLLSSCITDKSANNRVEKIEFKTTEYTINAINDTTIFGPQGTRVYIGANTFELPDGTLATDSIKIKLKEFYNKSDIILADLPTISNNRLLETGGMIYLEATSQGEKLEIRNNKNVVIHFPKEKNDKRNMDLFYSEGTTTDSSVVNWKVDSINLVKTTLKLGSYGWYYPEYGDSTGYDFIPKNYIDTGYYWNPLDFYIESYDFSEETKKEISNTFNRNDFPKFENWNDYGVECDVLISMDGYIKRPRINTKVSESTKNELIQFLNNLPQLEPGQNKVGEVIERRGLIFIQDGNVIPIYKTDEGYTKSFDNKYSKYEDEPIRDISDAELNYYVFSISKLGWINCDRFIYAKETFDLLVKTPVDSDTELKLAFNNINGLLKANIIDNQYVFQNIPKGEDATLIAIKNNSGKISTAFKELTLNEKIINDLEFEEITLSELRSKLERI